MQLAHCVRTPDYPIDRGKKKTADKAKNRVEKHQNRDFSENPRSGSYKNHKNVNENRSARGNCRKTMIFIVIH